MASLRIHPAIGVARIGNSDQFFIGPELPGVPGNWDGAGKRFLPFKDAQGRVLKQALRRSAKPFQVCSVKWIQACCRIRRTIATSF
jgi:hypothetical protein